VVRCECFCHIHCQTHMINGPNEHRSKTWLHHAVHHSTPVSAAAAEARFLSCESAAHASKRQCCRAASGLRSGELAPPAARDPRAHERKVDRRLRQVAQHARQHGGRAGAGRERGRAPGGQRCQDRHRHRQALLRGHQHQALAHGVACSARGVKGGESAHQRACALHTCSCA